jgi:hypothetical protein
MAGLSAGDEMTGWFLTQRRKGAKALRGLCRMRQAEFA